MFFIIKACEDCCAACSAKCKGASSCKVAECAKTCSSKCDDCEKCSCPPGKCTC